MTQGTRNVGQEARHLQWPPNRLQASLDRLVAENVLTAFQRDRLLAGDRSFEDLWADPYLRSIREHTRFYIETQVRQAVQS